MAYTTLVGLKKHLNIEEAFIEDDEYITSLIAVVELAIREFCGWAEAEYPDASIPVTVKQAAKLLAGHLYGTRTIVSFAQGYEIPYSFKYLLGPYKTYTVA